MKTELEMNINRDTGTISPFNKENENNIIDEEEKLTLSQKSMRNSEKELIDVPNIVKNYLKDNNVAIVTFKDFESVQITKCAYLRKPDIKNQKDFFFEFNENNSYYIFITKERNPNYLKPRVNKNKRKNTKDKLNNSKSSEDSDLKKEDNEKSEINFNFDYNKYLLKLVALKIPIISNGKTEVFKTDILNREICQISHTTSESITYFQKAKNIKPEKAKKNFEKFDLMLEKYYILELETKKPSNDTTIKEDGILSILYLMTASKSKTISLFTMIKYSLYFIKETLYNYIGKYIHNMIYDFCHLPSECFTDFLSHIGSLTKRRDSNYNLVFPLKKYIKALDSLSQKNLIYHMYRNLPNITKGKTGDRIPFHKFILLLEKYKENFATKEFKIKQKYLKGKKARKNYNFLKNSLIFDPINDKISKEHKINVNNVIKTLFNILEKYFNENFTKDKTIARNFMIQNLNKYLIQYTSLKGFINVDIILNEDNVFEFRCTGNKECNKAINNNMFGCVVGLLAGINSIFGFNEGFFHKHFTIMDYSYNFNEKNVIHTFLSINDSSVKNKVRIFDIPFMEKWSYQISGLLLYLYQEMFGFLIEKNKQEQSDNDSNPQNNFVKLFDEINSNISEDLFFYYEDILPDFYNFCRHISTSPLDKYNCLDNLCQNFANNSIYSLINNNVIFFNPFEAIYRIDQKDMINYPNLNAILEPYLIMVDERYKIYLNKKEKKEKYLQEIHMDIKTYYETLKNINIEKVHYCIFKGKNKKEKEKEKEKEEEDDDEEEKKQEKIEVNEEEEKDDELIEENNIKTNISIKDDDNKNENNNNKINDKENDDNDDINNEIITTTTETKSVVKDSNLNNIISDMSIESIYPKRFEKTIMEPISLEKINKELFDYYFLLNLYYNYYYVTLKELKTLFSNYEVMKRYISSIESSIGLSFKDNDRTIIKTTKEKKLNTKEIKKNQKKGLIKDLIILKKLTKLASRMNYIFCNYVNGVIEDIINDKKSNIANRNQLGEKHYLKIGHYMVDFLAYERKGIKYNSFQYFTTTDIYKKLFGDNNLDNNLNIIHTNI